MCYKLFLVFHRLIFLELVNIHIGWIKKLAVITYSVGSDMNLEAKNPVVLWWWWIWKEWADGNCLLGSFRFRRASYTYRGRKGNHDVILGTVCSFQVSAA